MTVVTHSQKLRCFGCKSFIDCTEAGDVRCVKEVKSVDNIVCITTIAECKKKKWREGR